MKIFSRSTQILVGLFLLFTIGVSGSSRTPEIFAGNALQAEVGQIIVNVTEARVRSAPNLNGEVLGATRIGSVYTVLRRENNWYNINFLGNTGGWISATIAEPFEDVRRVPIYHAIAAKYFKRESLDFDTASELFEFLTRIQPEVKNANVAPEMAYYRVLALAKAIEAIEFNYEHQPYKDFLKKYEAEIAYSEPAGQYAVRTTVWWELREAYAKSPIADEIAWKGANTLIPGECEGYVVCNLYILRETDGRYLEFFPNGKHFAQALKNLFESLESIAGGAAVNNENTGYYITPDPDDRVQLEKSVGELRTIVSKTPGKSKTKILASLDQIESGYRPEPFDETGLDDFWKSFRMAVVKKDKNAVAGMTQFPLEMPYGHKEIKSRAEFLKDYEKIMNLMTDAAKCFEKAALIKEFGRYGVYCGFKAALDDVDNKPNYYYFTKSESGWKFAGIDNINE